MQYEASKFSWSGGPEADDIVQELYMTAWFRRGYGNATFASEAARLSHVRQAIKWMAKNMARGDKPLTGNDFNFPAALIPALDDVIRNETIDAISDAVNDLTAEEQLILRLRFWEGKSWENIAHELGVTRNTGINRCNVALAKLRKFFGDVEE